MMKRTAAIKRLLICTVFAMAFASVGTTFAQDDITIRWAMHPGVWNDAAMNHFAPLYSEITPGVNVVVELLPPDEIRDKMALEAAARTNYYQMGYHSQAWFGFYHDRVADLTEFIEKYDFDLSAYSDTVIQGYMFNDIRPGEYIALPHYLSTTLFIYRTDWFDHPDEQAAFQERFGRELRVPQNQHEFYETALFFTRDAGETLAGEVLTQPVYGTADAMRYPSGAARSWLTLFYSMGFAGFDENFEPDFVDHPLITEGAEWLRRLTEDTMPPQVLNWNLWEPIEFFREGRVAMSTMGSGGHSIVEADDSAVRGLVGYTTIPVWEGNLSGKPIGASNLAGGGLLVFDTPHAEETFKFIQWMLEENSAEFLRRTGAFSRIEHFEDPVMSARPYFDEWAAAFAQQVEYAFLRQGIPEYGTVIFAMAGDFWNDVLSGDLTPEQAAERWAREMRREFQAAGYYN